MKLTLLLSALPALAMATGAYIGACVDQDGNRHYQESKDCCAAIGGGKHYFPISACRCESLGGIAFRRVWVEALDECCKSRGLVGAKTCNSECGMGKCLGDGNGVFGSFDKKN